MRAKSWTAIGMLALTCGWAAWLFGSVDWAGAQKAPSEAVHGVDTGVAALADSVGAMEKQMREYLHDFEKRPMAVPAGTPSTASKSRNIFGGSGRTPARPDDDLDIIVIDPNRPLKPSFPVDRFKLVGVLTGPDPRAFVLDGVENKTISLRVNDNLLTAAVDTITPHEVVLRGAFGRVVLSRRTQTTSGQ